MFERLVRPHNRNTLAYASILDAEGNDDDNTRYYTGVKGNSRDISPSLRRAFSKALGAQNSYIPATANSTNRLTTPGASYTTSAVHEGNSGIICKGSNAPFSIVDILEFSNNSGPGRMDIFWFVVKRYRKATGLNTDPYAKYPHLKAKLWDTELEDDIEVLPLSSVQTHFAKCTVPIQGINYTVVVSLDRSTPV